MGRFKWTTTYDYAWDVWRIARRLLKFDVLSINLLEYL
jgi:hypothetical protein